MDIKNNTLKLNKYLENFLVKKFKESENVSKWSVDVKDKLLGFCTSGKMMRGNLVMLASGRTDLDTLKVASAIEVVHSSFLIHDDIMDEDLLRRGKPSIYASYSNDISSKSHNPKHYGISQAITVGDIGIFLSLFLLNNIVSENKTKIINCFLDEVTRVGFGQMEDVYFGFVNDEPTVLEIMSIYRSKTARYSISVPIVLGMYLNKEKESLIKQVTLAGEYLGIVFQMKDDELGVFGNTENTGKGVLKDVNQNKKTLIRHLLFNSCNTKERAELKNIFGKKDLNKAQTTLLINLLEKYDIKTKHEDIAKGLLLQADKIIKKMPKKYKDIFEFIQEYNNKRNK